MSRKVEVREHTMPRNVPDSSDAIAEVRELEEKRLEERITGGCRQTWRPALDDYDRR